MREHRIARRTKVAKHPGVYYRESRIGRRYEITFLDATGARRWRTVDGGLREAQAALEDARQRSRHGERTAPASAPRVADYADAWLERKTKLRERTREKYEVNLRVHVKPRLGRLKVSDVREDDVARLVREMEVAGKSGATIQGVLVALGGMLNAAVRDGLLPSNPVHRLQRDERPRIGRKEKRALSTDEIALLLDSAPDGYRAFLATAVFAGLRLSELLGLRWSDVDFDGGLLHVRRQWDRSGVYSEPKTADSVRAVMLIPSLVRTLAEHRVASRFSGDDDPVFVSSAGTPLGWRNVERRGMNVAVARAGLDRVPGKRRPTLHDLRHTFASMLIAHGLDVVFVSRQLGHKDPTVTLRVYADLFDRARHTDLARAAIEAAVGNLLETNPGDARRTADAASGPNVAPLRASASGGV